MSDELENFSTIIGAIYEAALDSGRWGTLAPLFAKAFAAESCTLQLRNNARNRTVMLGQNSNHHGKAHAAESDFFHKVDLWVEGASRVGREHSVFGQRSVPDSIYFASELYSDFSHHFGALQGLGGTVEVDEENLGIIGIHRPHGANAFSDSDRQALDLILPHLTRALQLHARLEGLRRERRLALDAIETLAIGMMVVAANGRLLFTNAKAEKELRARRALMVSRGCLRAVKRDLDNQLDRLLRQAAPSVLGAPRKNGGVMAMPFEDGGALFLLMSPLSPGAVATEGALPMAMIFIADPGDKAVIPSQVLAEFYGLTPAESRLAAALLAGDRIENYAELSGISRETARTLLKRVFTKMGCSRQSDLIREALGNPILAMHGQRRKRGNQAE